MSDQQADELRRRNDELRILNAIAEALNRSTKLDQALQAALAQVAELLSLHTAWVWLLREPPDHFYLAAAQNLPESLITEPERMEDSCYCLDTYVAGDLAGAANINVVSCSRLRKLMEATDLRYHASIPLYAHGQQLGVLNVASPDWRKLTSDDLQLLHTIGDLLSIAIERAQLFDRSLHLGAVEERNRLAREIHDTLAQSLTAVVLQLETADALLEASDSQQRARQAITRALTLTRGNLDEVRRSVLDLRAAPLEGRTLAEALAALIDSSQELPPVELATTGAHVPLPVRIEIGLYRIAQEGLQNVVRHAGATRVSISLMLTPQTARLILEDNGRGFDPTAVGPEHFGLVGIRERARLLGGSARIDSGSGRGTRLEIDVPLN